MQNRTIEIIKTGLLSNLDSENNVTNIEGALAAIKSLEEYPMTKELLEQTRIGKHVNELRKKTTHKELSRRAKDLVKKWQLLVNVAAGSNQSFKKDDPSRKIPNGVHSLVSHTPSPTLSTCSSVSGSRSNLNGKVKSSEGNKLLAKNISAELGKFAQPSGLGKIPSAASSPALSDIAGSRNNVPTNISRYNSLNNNSTIHNNNNNNGNSSQAKDSKAPFQTVNSHAINNNNSNNNNISRNAINNIKNTSSPKLPILPTASSLSSLIPKSASVINGTMKSQVPPPTSCDKSSLKRQLDVPFANVNNVNHKKMKIDIDNASSKSNGSYVVNNNNNNNSKNNVNNFTKNEGHKKLNGTLNTKNGNHIDSNNDALEKKMFSWQVSSIDLKCKIRTLPMVTQTSPAAVTNHQLTSDSLPTLVPSLIANNSASTASAMTPSNISNNKTIVKNTKAETTSQLIKKLQSNGELGITPSPTISRIMSNQIVKERSDDEDGAVVPAGAKPRPHKKRTKLQPPTDSIVDLVQVKNEMMQKFLRNTQNISNYSTDSLDGSNDNNIMTATTTSTIECSKEEKSQPKDLDITKLDPNSDEYRRALLSNPWAFLPPLNSLEIKSDDEEDYNHHQEQEQRLYQYPTTCPIENVDEVDKLLTTRWSGVNGHFDFNNNWQPWTKTYSVKTYNDDYLHILPYVSLDF